MIQLTYIPALDLNPAAAGLTISTPGNRISFQPNIPVSLEDTAWEQLQTEKPYQERVDNGSLVVEVIPETPPETPAPKSKDKQK